MESRKDRNILMWDRMDIQPEWENIGTEEMGMNENKTGVRRKGRQEGNG